MSAHKVILIRHAKAAHPSGTGDIDRPLNDAGVAEARDLARKIEADLDEVGAVLVSAATRAQQTWSEIAGELSNISLPNPVLREQIYAGDAQEIIDIIRLEGRGRTTIVVGHEPTISETGYQLAKSDVNVPGGMPTGSALIMEASKDWKEWHTGVAETATLIVSD